jgi:plasmid rolling circle replication initiator protein Rep
MENTICECWEEYSNLEDITNVKKQIKDTLDE